MLTCNHVSDSTRNNLDYRGHTLHYLAATTQYSYKHINLALTTQDEYPMIFRIGVRAVLSTGFAIALFFRRTRSRQPRLCRHPIQVEMASTGSSGRSQISVTNDGKEPMPIEITIQKLTLDENGDRKTSKARRRISHFSAAGFDPARRDAEFPDTMGRRAATGGKPELHDVGQPDPRETAARAKAPFRSS